MSGCLAVRCVRVPLHPGTRVRLIEKRGGKGKIEIEFYSPDDLDRIYSVILGE
jgi:hypothetical protein